MFLGYSILAGEIVHQLRSALDHLVWQLILDEGATPIDGKTGFPVFHIEADYDKYGVRMIAGVATQTATDIRSLQPFHTNPADTAPLYVLNEMWKREKHRLLNFASLKIMSGCTTAYVYPSGRTIVDHGVGFNPGPFTDGAELCRLQYPSDFTPDVKMSVTYAWAMRFEDAGPATGQSPTELLTRLVEVVEKAIMLLDR